VVSASKTGGGLRIGQALTKTITFRIIVTSLGLTSNYFVLADVATAVGPSSFALVIAPVLYFSHETMWNWSTVVGPPLPNPDFCHLTAAIGHGSHARRCVWRNWTLRMHSAAAPIPPHRRRVGSNREHATDDPIIRRCQSDL